MNKSNIKMNFNHPYYLISPSPWPLLSSFSIMMMAFSLLGFFYHNNYKIFLMNIILTALPIALWWRDLIRESSNQGWHTSYIQKNIRLGMILFIISELFFFISFFWANFHMSLSPSIEIGSMWPPKGILMINPYKVPMLNTIILISSGFSVTWCHFSILMNKKYESIMSLTLTIMLGIVFTSLQIYEYYMSPFTISDSVYGSVFFISTGFHGIHVIIGSTFLFICLLQLKWNNYNKINHTSFELAAWYWHFVDVIWLFLYIFIYWWNY